MEITFIEFVLVKFKKMSNKRFFLYLPLLIVFLSCSEKSASEHDFTLEITPIKKIYLKSSQISSEIDFLISTIPFSEDSILVYNGQVHSIDTLILGDTSVINAGRILSKEGPGSVLPFDFFKFYKGNFFFLSGEYLGILNNGSTRYISTSKILKETDKSSFTFQYNLGPLWTSFDQKNGSILLWLSDYFLEKQLLLKYNIVLDEFQTLYFEPNPRIRDHIIRMNQGHIQIENPYFPNFFFEDTTIVISYPFLRDIQKINLKDNSMKSILVGSNLFKGSKATPQMNTGFDDFMKFKVISDTWQDDIYFGPIYKYPRIGYFRIVRDEITNGTSEKFIEVFDWNLTKLYESSLSSLSEDLDDFYFPIGDQIIFRSKTQGEEDVFSYYAITILNKSSN